MKRAILSFTPSLSKRLIAKGVAALPEVQRAFQQGKILISAGTTTAYVHRELCGSMPEGALACGMVTQKGLCVGSGMTEFLGTHGHAGYWYFHKGRPDEPRDLEAVLEGFSADDVFIKGANALDSSGMAGILLGVDTGGTTGKAIGAVMAKGVHFVIPVGLEKAVLGSIAAAAKEMGIQRVDTTSGMPVGLIPVSGRTVTESQALGLVAGVEVYHAASGGISGAEGAVTLLVTGRPSELDQALALYRDLRDADQGESSDLAPARCADHKWPNCVARNMLYKTNIKEKR